MSNTKQPTEYTFFWLTGLREVLPGKHPHECLNNAGYGAGALRALDFYALGDCKEYEWDQKYRTWKKLAPITN